MADTLQLNRIQKFYGGISGSDKDTKVGVASNFEEVDIFSNEDYMQPEERFVADSTITRRISGYTIGDMNDITVAATLYALGRDASGTPVAQLWRKTSASSTSPGAWSAVKTSAFTSNAVSPLKWHRVTVAVTSITRASQVATITTTYSHGLTTNDIVSITVSGADQQEYNGTYKGTATGANTITYTISGSPSSPATYLLSGALTVSFAFLFYVTGTRQLTRATITDSTSPGTFSESTSDLASTPASMTLAGLGAADDRIPMERYNGELFIGHGRYVAKVSTDGICTPYAFTLPAGWQAVSFAPFAHNLAILARAEATGDTHCKVFYWDLTNTTGYIDESIITVGGPQIIVNFDESLIVLCAYGGILYPYVINNKKPVELNFFIENVYEETDGQPTIPDATKFVKDGLMYFGMKGTNKTGLYAIGQTQAGYSCVLSKRFSTAAVSSITSSGTTATLTTDIAHGLSAGDDIIVSGANETAYNGAFRVVTAPTTTSLTYTMTAAASATPATGSILCTNNSYENDTPYAAIGIGGNFYASYSQDGTASVAKGEGASQTRSSNAVYETILVDLGDPETPKAWMGFMIGTKPMNSGCQIYVDAHTDNDSAYDTASVKQLTTSNDQTDSGFTADTYWFRTWTSLMGRAIKIRLRFLSSTTNAAQVYFLSFLSQRGNII